MSLLTDVQILKKAPIAEVRENIAVKVADYLNSDAFEGDEVKIAHDIIRLLTKDVEMRVRKALAESLKENDGIPHDVAISLARDEVEVSIPILETSGVLTEGDLLEIVRSTKEVAKISAIAKRPNISETVSSAIVHTHIEEPVVELINNKTSNLSDTSIVSLIQEFKEQGNVLSCLIDRGGLSIGIAEKLLNFVTGDLHSKLVSKYELSDDAANNLVASTHEKATLGLLDDNNDAKPKIGEFVDDKEKLKAEKAEKLVTHLNNVGRLTHSLVIRSLCEGNILFFETSMAVLSGIPVVAARRALRECEPSAVKAICKKADIPSSFWDAIYIIVKFSVDNGDTSEKNKGTFASRLTEYVLSNGYDSTVTLMPYILVLVGSSLQSKDIIKG